MAENLTFPAQTVGEAIGCIDPPLPPKGGCGCACKPGGAGPGGRGGGAGPGSDGGGAGPGGGKGFGGAPLRYQAGGAGHPGYPGSVAWRQRLGLYWSHEYAQRIVPDPDETHAWLIIESAIFREFSALDGGGVYQTVSPSNEYRTLTWTDPS